MTSLIGVTLTGAGHYTQLSQLEALSERYPFIEWGILYSPTKAGHDNRYPSEEWIDWVLRKRSLNMKVSLHLCGNAKAEFAEGISTGNHWKGFDRIQFNVGKTANRFVNRIYNTSDLPKFAKDNKVIIGGHVHEIKEFPEDALPLFDLSGGRGVVDIDYEEPFQTDRPNGYCGGLNIENLFYQYHLITEVAGDSDIWIDIETGARNKKNIFDLSICAQLLNMIEPIYINSNT
jgi:hypothetical protein